MRTNLLSYISGLFTSDIAKTAFEGLIGEGLGKIKDYAAERLIIQKGGKGLEDEIIFSEITLDEKLLDADSQLELDKYLGFLRNYDSSHGTRRHADFILFIAKGAEILRKVKEYPDGEGKNKKVIEKEVRVTERGINFIKSMLKYSSKNDERMQYCLNRRVFDENIENRRKKMNEILGEAEHFVFTQLDIDSWKELNLEKLQAGDRMLANKIEAARLKLNPKAKKDKVEIAGMVEIVTFGGSKKFINWLKK